MSKKITYPLLIFLSKQLTAQKFAPPAGKQLLIIGQYLNTVKYFQRILKKNIQNETENNLVISQYYFEGR